MGQVYRARDVRLERTVAIKVLASHLSSSSELKQRMEREARSICRPVIRRMAPIVFQPTGRAHLRTVRLRGMQRRSALLDQHAAEIGLDANVGSDELDRQP